jgi:hypothetical protein
MAVTRADTLTQTVNKQEYFSDFLNSFALTPVGNNLGKISNEVSVKQSLKNLIYTNLGERLFQPNVGSNILNSLFEPNGKITLANIEFNIKNTIKYNEPRVNLLQAKARSTYDENQIQIDLVFTLINNPDPISLSFILKRVR